MTYDLLSRLDTKTNSEFYCGQSVSVNYDYDATINGNKGIGRRTSMTSGSISNSWTYDLCGRVASETVMGYKTSYTHNLADLVTSMTYPTDANGGQGEEVTYAYNSRMLLNTVSGTNFYVTSTGYDSAGRITSRALGNNTQTDYVYYPWTADGGRLQYLKSGTSGNPTSLQNLTYAYDAAGNVSTITNSIANETNTYGYDTLDRLTSWTLNSTTENYSYDSATGNLDLKADLDLNYNDAAHKHAVTHIGSTQKYWYDANGNQIKRISNGKTIAMEYDAENRLVKVCEDTSNNSSCNAGETVIATFAYDGDGKRVKSVMGSTTTLFIGAHYKAVTVGSTTTFNKYYFAGASRIAMQTGSTLTYLLTDHLNSTSITTNSTGGLVSELRYKPWGETRFSSGSTSTKYQYTGQFSYEADFGLMFYNARFYDSQLGRFTSADSVIPESQGVQAWDRYAYVNNNPLRYTDPTGHDPKCRNQLECAKLYGLLNPNQVEVTTAVKTQSQNTEYIMTSLGLGWNACGVVAASYAGASLEALAEAVKNTGQFYAEKDVTHPGGIQPSYYAAAVKSVYGINRVAVYNRNDPAHLLKELSYEMQSGGTVIVDFRVVPDVAHFAVVIRKPLGAPIPQ